jgi:hypothetical protein
VANKSVLGELLKLRASSLTAPPSPLRLRALEPSYAVTDDGDMGEVAATLVGGLLILGGTGLLIYLYQRSLDKPGGRDGLGATGDMFGNLIEVFNPGHDRARRALKEIEHAGPVTPTPDDLDKDPIRLLTNPDGTPRAIRIRRPH